MKNLTKLYDQTPPEALAALVFGAACRGDQNDIKLLHSAVAGDRGRHARYRQRREGIQLAALLWANDCLRTQATMVTLSAIIASGEAIGDQIIKFDALHGAYKAKLAALHAAMGMFAHEVGIDMAAIKGLAEADCVPAPDDLPPPDQAQVADLLSGYRALL